MNLSISSLAWKPPEDEAVASLLIANGYKGIELVPTKIWPDLSQAKEQEVKDYRKTWDARGIRIVSLQALLFGRDDLTLFGSEAKRAEGIEYFKSIFKVAQWLGTRVLIYGSPKNRKGVNSQDESILKIAENYFRRLGVLANDAGVCLCLEPLPRSYPCVFITSSSEALQFVKRLNQNGFGLHLDAASLYMAGEDVQQAIRAAQGRIEHFHVSEPGLAPVTPESPVPIGDYLKILSVIGYKNWVSIEMLEPNPKGSNVVAIEQSLRYVRGLADQVPAQK